MTGKTTINITFENLTPEQAWKLTDVARMFGNQPEVKTSTREAAPESAANDDRVEYLHYIPFNKRSGSNHAFNSDLARAFVNALCLQGIAISHISAAFGVTQRSVATTYADPIFAQRNPSLVKGLTREERIEKYGNLPEMKKIWDDYVASIPGQVIGLGVNGLIRGGFDTTRPN